MTQEPNFDELAQEYVSFFGNRTLAEIVGYYVGMHNKPLNELNINEKAIRRALSSLIIRTEISGLVRYKGQLVHKLGTRISSHKRRIIKKEIEFIDHYIITGEIPELLSWDNKLYSSDEIFDKLVDYLLIELRKRNQYLSEPGEIWAIESAIQNQIGQNSDENIVPNRQDICHKVLEDYRRLEFRSTPKHDFIATFEKFATQQTTDRV